ncbi:hypothetical protein Tco_0932491 [Tanacetum coccineum]
MGFPMELKTLSSVKTTGLLQLMAKLSQIFPRSHKDKVGMQIPDWMITEEMKHTEHYMMYAEVFGLDVPLTQSQPTESTQGRHRTPSAPRSPTPKKDTAKSSAPKRSTVICFCLSERRSTRLTPPVLVPTVEKAKEMVLQDTLQVSLAEHKARENVELVNKHLASEEIEKLVEGSENVIDDSLPPRNDEPQIPGTRLEPRSDKESLEVERTNDEERREKGKILEDSRSTPLPILIRSTMTHTNLASSNTEKLQELMVTIKQHVDYLPFTRAKRTGRILMMMPHPEVENSAKPAEDNLVRSRMYLESHRLDKSLKRN